LKNKVSDLADKYGDDVSVIDESEQRRMMEVVEKEMERLKEKDWNEIPDAEIAEIPDNDILKEEDRFTDMSGFDTYLTMIYGEKQGT
jgi:hypothetical protein